jgi:hypothetical protein
VVNVQVPLTAFYFAGPLLAVVIFLHLQIGLVELKRLMLRVSIEPSAPRIYPWIVPRSILLLNRKLSWQFTDQLQVVLTLLSVYASLPLVLFVFATAYTRAHAPTLSYVVATLPVLGSVLAIVFYFNMVEGGLRSIREVIRSEWGLLLAALVIGTIPYDIIVVIDAILLYLAVLPLVIVAAILAVGFIGIVAISRSAPLQARLRKAWQKVGIWLLLIVMVVATTMVFAVFEHSLSIVAFSSLAIAPLALTIAYVMGGIKGRPPPCWCRFCLS